MMGAGDAKYAAAMAPFIALADAISFMLLLAGTIIAAFILHRLARNNAHHPRCASLTGKAGRIGVPDGICAGARR